VSFLGIICGLQLEAKCFELAKYSDKIRVAVSAANPQRAETEARRLSDAGAKGLLSFGLCAALDPKLKPGDLVAPSQILSDHDLWGISPFLVGRAAVHCEFGLGSDRIIADVEEKSKLFKSTKAAIVDMESHRVGKICNDKNIPFFVLRVVCDPARQAIPKSAANAIDDEGRMRPFAVARGLLMHPGEFSDLMRLKKQTEIAQQTLRRAAAQEVPRILRGIELV
jgi:hopanoid-associated phosphorylase